MKRFNNLSLFRLIAALAILLFHLYFCLDKSSASVNLLSKLVQGLTVLSGFLYGRRIIENKKSFYSKNITKILSPAIITIAITAIMTFVIYLINPDKGYLSLWFSNSHEGYRLFIFGNFWYIPIIIICYLFTPVLALARDKKNPYAIILIIMGIFLELIMAAINLSFPISFSCYVLGYFFSTIDSVYYKLTDDKFYLKPFLTSVILIIIFLAIYYHSYDFLNGTAASLIANIAATGFGATTFFFIALLAKGLNKKDSLKAFFRLTDTISYPFYLLNQFFMSGVFTIYINDSLLLSGIIIFILTALFAAIISLIDKFINLLCKRAKNKAQSLPA